MADFVRVADAGAVPAGGIFRTRAGSYDIALFNVDGTIYALEDTCPHQGAPLSDGYLDGDVVTCSWHGWCFDVRTGKMTLGDFAIVPHFEVRMEDGSIFVATEPIEEA